MTYQPHRLPAFTARGTLVLLFVCLLAPFVHADEKTTPPVATAVSATVSGTTTRIVIAGTAPMAYAVHRPDGQTLAVDLPGVDASKLASVYAVSTPLIAGLRVERTATARSGQSMPRLTVTLRAPVRERSQLSDNKLVLELWPDNNDTKAKAAKAVETTNNKTTTPAVSVPAEAKTVAAPAPVDTSNSVAASSETSVSSAEASTADAQNPQERRPVAPTMTTVTPQGKRYGDPGFMGEPINLNVVNADIRDILNYITEQYGVNFVIDSSVKAVPVTVNVTEVPWNIALDSILQANRLGIVATGSILRVATGEVIATEAAIQSRIAEARLSSAPLMTEFIRLNYARAVGTLAQAAGSAGGFAGGTTAGSFSGGSGGDATGASGEQGILPIVSRRLSRRGSVEVDGRSNTLIITDVRDNIEAIRQLVTLLDQPEPQVEIETRIVLATRNFTRDLGVELSAVALGRNGRAINFDTTNVLRADLPSTIIGLTTGFLGTVRIDAAITAAERQGNAKLVGTPRVTALNNRTAQIETGQQIPVITPQIGASQNGVLLFTTTYVSVPLRLSVTPQITDVGTVILRVVAENNTVNTTVTFGSGAPGIDTQRMQTEVLVPDGGTTVIGGVLNDVESSRKFRTPGLGSVPVLGNLFKRSANDRTTAEILFFITPRIYRPDYQGRPTNGTVSNSTRTTSISQPVPMGNPQSNTPVPTQSRPTTTTTAPAATEQQPSARPDATVRP
ncbi:MAG TPA: type IV pilus secretin PilQ [Pyrinomonadaceae bacterium]